MATQTKTKRQLQAEQTKNRVFYAAVQLLAEKEFDDITIRDIITRAEVSIGTFYHYYATKLDVFYETFRMADDYFIDEVAPSLTQKTTYENILLFFNHYATYNAIKIDRQMLRLLYNPSNTFFNRDPHQGMHGVLVDLIEQGFKKGEIFTCDSAEYIARYLMICTRGLVYNWCTTNYAYDLHAEMHRFVTLLLKAYFQR